VPARGRPGRWFGLLAQQPGQFAQRFVELRRRRGDLHHELAGGVQHVGRAGGVVGQAALLAQLVEQR
jgi:hypothetical protein